MAYFNHAFKKVFFGTEGLVVSGSKLGVDVVLQPGQLAFVNPKTWTTVDLAAVEETCCPLVLAAGSLYQNDKLGGGTFHGGYKESTKSKIINPKYVSKIWASKASDAQRSILHIGNTPYTVVGEGEIGPNCDFAFFCNETYRLRIDVKGSPALRFLTRNSYLTVDAFGGCCPEGSDDPVRVDSTLIMIQWAEEILRSPLINPFILPVVIAEDGTVLYAPGTDPALVAAVPGADTWDNYVSTGHSIGQAAGLVLNGAYVDTKFGNCSFMKTDHYELEPVRLYASMTLLDGEPCPEGICVVEECPGRQEQGVGETVFRDVILSESYSQNYFSPDTRIREVMQSQQLFDVVDRFAKYDRVYILHNVPRFNNPTGVFDNDQYLLEVIFEAGTTDAEDFLQIVVRWVTDCNPGCIVQDVEPAEGCPAPLIAINLAEAPEDGDGDGG
jgi:hypothetical protein